MKRIVILVLLLFTFLLSSCSKDDIGYPQFKWLSAVELPSDFSISTFTIGEPGEFFFSGSLYETDPYSEYEVIYRYRDGDFDEVYRRKQGDNHWFLDDADYREGVYWAAGINHADSFSEPFIFRIYNGQCEEFPGPDCDSWDIPKVISIGPNEVFVFDEDIRYRFVNGIWDSIQLPFKDHYSFIYNQENGLIYTYEGGCYDKCTCRISDDYFDTYIEEEIVIADNCPVTGANVRFTGSTIFGDKIYFSAQLLTDTRIWFALIERSGLPGDGEYRVIYRRDKQIGSWGTTLALSDGEIVSTIEGTTLMFHYKDGEAFIEDNAPYSIQWHMVRNGDLTWAIGRKQFDDDDYFRPSELIYHIPDE